jgi:hypothetical protein
MYLQSLTLYAEKIALEICAKVNSDKTKNLSSIPGLKRALRVWRILPVGNETP